MSSHTWGASDWTHSVDSRRAIIDSLRRVTVKYRERNCAFLRRKLFTLRDNLRKIRSNNENDFHYTRWSEHHPQWHKGHSDHLAWLCSKQNQWFLFYIVYVIISTFLVSRLPGVTQDLAAVRWVSLHVTGKRQGARHKCHTVAKIIICRIQLELSLLGKTYKSKNIC